MRSSKAVQIVTCDAEGKVGGLLRHATLLAPPRRPEAHICAATTLPAVVGRRIADTWPVETWP